MQNVIAATLCLAVLAVRLQPTAVSAWDRYVQLTEARIQQEVADPSFMVFSAGAYARLRKGELILEERKTLDQGREIRFEGAIPHHFVASIFIPNGTLERTLQVVEDYDRYQTIHAQDISKSRTLERHGHDARIFLAIRQKKGVTATIDVEMNVHYTAVDAKRAWSARRSTRVAEVENPGEAKEREKPIGDDRGFLWRLNSYWRFWEKDGGTYLQVESISLSRSGPALVAWVFNSALHGVHRDFLTHMVVQTREAVVALR